MKYSTEQRKVLSAFLEQKKDEPLSAAEISRALTLQGYKISPSAVYRNLNSLTEEGTAKTFFAEDGRTRLFQLCDCEGDHLHLKCENCGKLLHIGHTLSDKIASVLADGCGFSTDREKTVLYGVCSDCKCNEAAKK